MLHDQLAWYVAGPALGLCVVAVRLLFNARLGVTGGFSELVGKLSRGSVRFDWRGWFAIGIFAGGALFALIAGGPDFHGYGWLTDAFTGSSRIWIVPILFFAGILIGYGAKVAGGCTSGNGLSGTSSLSPASLAATATFFGTAIVVSFVTRALT
ncbi:MAG TPA: YeeE/YedE thiosulfate transporter family protein [Thermoleophilaceae bacterium]|nr:YeeE/YedE thiosulfate transporter family protein [Thermoleophilaceae bacterium]